MQQKASASQTQAVMSASSQPAVASTVSSQQSPAQTPQSSVQVWQSSTPLQVPSPQSGQTPQSASQVTQSSNSEQVPSPQTAHSAQSEAAAPAQMLSQLVSQQKVSWAHTAAVQSASEHSGVSLATQQSGGHSPQSAAQLEQSSVGSQASLPHSASQPQPS